MGAPSAHLGAKDAEVKPFFKIRVNFFVIMTDGTM